MSASGSRARRDSGHTHLSLLHIDPTPMTGFSPAASPIGDLDRSFSVHSLATSEGGSLEKSTGSVNMKGGGSAMGPGLRTGPGRGAIFYLTRIQRYSSYATSLFVSLHLANVSLIPALTRSVPGSETYLLMTREIYQTPLTEPLLVALPVLAHVSSGIALRLARRFQNGTRYGAALPGFFAWRRWASHEGRAIRVWPRLSYVSLSGYAFSCFYAAHAFVNRVLPLVFDGDSANIGLAYVSHGFARHPWIARAAYAGLLLFGCGHMVWGTAKWLGVDGRRDDSYYMHYSTTGSGGVGGGTNDWEVLDTDTKGRERRTWWALQAAVVAAVAAWAVGGIGVVSRAGEGEGWIGQLYDHLFAQVGL